MALRRRFSPVLPFGKPGNLGFFSFRPKALRPSFSTGLLFSDSQAVLAFLRL
jgi:hypothetical protein